VLALVQDEPDEAEKKAEEKKVISDFHECYGRWLESSN
jgi:hypothetical protein